MWDELFVVDIYNTWINNMYNESPFSSQTFSKLRKVTMNSINSKFISDAVVLNSTMMIPAGKQTAGRNMRV